MSDSPALDSFLEKWRTRWPEWSVAEIFVPQARRLPAVAWFALLQEFDDALNIAGDPLPADAKLGWWGEELHGWAQRRSRHPLGRVLEPLPAAWTQLADALPGLQAARTTAETGDAAFASLSAYAEAVAMVETEVLGASIAPSAILAQVLATRLAETGNAAIPSSIARQAGEGEHADLRAWGMQLQQHWGDARQGARERRILAGYAQRRLDRLLQSGRPAALPSRAALLFSGWRAARGA
ncbi:phytoene/squalene synthase family protein [Pseudoxanthomonas kalamensis DSM 18571]|uniref:phytoene/squalene synthase family protein n=1 Tax=Pseudoxanthomonas kalamensis TaxID=289483 RepID=UPI001391B6DF|nr:phytoene/squalene synthase family protein [Pseudoxanthomonas kalamensis]KAF1710408.1 phytoene/squalene synthase family protein [Pseudoxanthomonas kalamensis DSM 18571]